MCVYTGRVGARDVVTRCVRQHARVVGAAGAVCVAVYVARRRQPRREAALRRPAQQLQQAGAARAQRQRRAHRAHQAQALPAHRRGASLNTHYLHYTNELVYLIRTNILLINKHALHG